MLFKNKKAELDQAIKIMLWIIFFMIALFGVGVLVRTLTG